MDRDEKGRFIKGHKNFGAGRKRRVEEQEMLALFDTAAPISKRIQIIRKQVEKALRGNLEAAKWLWSYMYGNPVQRSEVSGSDGDAMKILVEYVRSTPED